MNDIEILKNLVLAPYILKATTLIGVKRRSGGNAFRHCFDSLSILLDYKYFSDSILLKASLIHDLLEDWPETDIEELRNIDHEGPQVVELVLEVTRRKGETKPEYLQRVLEHGSNRALILKCADRISNLIDRDTHSCEKMSETLDQTEQFILPMARKVNADMVIELTDLIAVRREIIKMIEVSKPTLTKQLYMKIMRVFGRG